MEKVKIGSEITVVFSSGIEERFKLMPDHQANLSLGLISEKSLFGQAVIGRTQGETFAYRGPIDNYITCRIVKIENAH